MKKEILFRFLLLFVLLALVTVFKKWFSLTFWPLWVGGVLGMLLSETDQIIYVFLIRPYELTSQRIITAFKSREYRKAFYLLLQTRGERQNLIFHSLLFEAIFLLLAFWVISSTGSLLGRGLVLAILLSLWRDQLKDLKINGNLDKWFVGFSIPPSREKCLYFLGASMVLILVLGILF